VPNIDKDRSLREALKGGGLSGDNFMEDMVTNADAYDDLQRIIGEHKPKEGV